MTTNIPELGAEVGRYRAQAAQAFDLLRDPGHACSSVGFLMLGTDWRITVYRVPREADPAREPASAGRRHAFVWIAQHDATEEELDGGAAVELDTPEAAWNAAVEVLARRMVRQFRLSPALAEPPRRTPAAANGADPGEHRPRAVAGQGA
jgi:hypothetical protein